MQRLRVANITTDSIVDGQGLRLVVFTQGCKRRCKGCHNPETHDLYGGYFMSTKRIMNLLLTDPLQIGITFSGGEPFLQPKPCAEIAQFAHLKEKDVWCYTGFLYEDLLKNGKDYSPERFNFLKEIDVLVDGEFKEEEKSLNLKFKGSKNQRIIDVKKSFEAKKTVLYKFKYFYI